MMDDKRLLQSYEWEHPFPLTLKAYENRPSSEKRYAVVLAHNSAQHAWHYLGSIWEMINEEMVADLKFTKELLKEGSDSQKLINQLLKVKEESDIEKIRKEFDIEKTRNLLFPPKSNKRSKCVPAHITSFYIYARIFLDRSAAIYPMLTFCRRMPSKKRGSLPQQYNWLGKNKSKEYLPYFKILERHWSALNDCIIRPRNKLISHASGSTEQFRMGGGRSPRILYEKFSLDDETFLLDLLKKYGDLIGEHVAYPKQDAPNAIKRLIEQGDKLDPQDLSKLRETESGMREELPLIEEAIEHIDSFRLDLDRYYSALINRGILTSCD